MAESSDEKEQTTTNTGRFVFFEFLEAVSAMACYYFKNPVISIYKQTNIIFNL